MRRALTNGFNLCTLAFLLAFACPRAFSQQPPATLPVVTSTGAADYPPVAETARIEGAVRVRVYTDQGKVLWLQVQDGPPLLHQAASDYIRTWQFQQKEQMNFLVTLQYRIEEIKECGPQKLSVVPHFPAEVDITDLDTRSCDILATVLARNKPVTINFSVELNGEAVAPPSQVSLTFDGRPLNLPVQNGQFTVPIDVVRAQSVVFAVSLPGNEITTTVAGNSFASDAWTLRLADHAFSDDLQGSVPKGAKVRASCILTLESAYGDAGTFNFDPHCRTVLKPSK